MPVKLPRKSQQGSLELARKHLEEACDVKLSTRPDLSFGAFQGYAVMQGRDNLAVVKELLRREDVIADNKVDPFCPGDQRCHQ